jgi:hypothetical protein
MDDSELDALIEKLKSERPSRPEAVKAAKKRTALSQDAPAPQTNGMIARRGMNVTTRALEAWGARVRGENICDTAHALGISIEDAKVLIREAHAAIHEDLKENLNLNRELDLQRVDGLIKSYYGEACAGDEKAANVILKCLAQRAQLTGNAAPPDAGRSHPENVLIWVQHQLPSIHKIVDSLPPD